MKKKIAILGSTGSIGQTTFNIIKNDKKNFKIVLLSTNKNIDRIFTDPNLEIIGITGINEARKKFKDGDLIIDVRAGYQFNDIVKFGFVVNNLLNREYMTRPATMMPPRTFAFQCSLKI